MNSKTTKRALIMSVLSLVVCISMLIGTTFAWFTDSVTSANNIIKSGNLDVELEYSTDMTNWTPVTSTTNVFKDGALWEPGYTEVVYLRVSNKGSLALKYELGVNIASEIEGINKAGETFKLSQYIEYGVIEDVTAKYDDRNLARAAVTSAAKLNAAITKSGSLLAKAEGATEYPSKVVAMVVYMPETVGNEANHNGTVPVINLGVNLLATQFTYEKDSFDELYDENAPFGTYIELNAGDNLLNAMASAEADMPLTIKLNGDVEWPTDGHHGENDITPASSIVIDGNGNTITATGSGITPLGDTKAPMTIKNAKIVDNSVSYDEGSWELSYLEMGGNVLNCVNVDFADPIQVVSETSTFTNCSFVGHYDKNSTSTTQYGVWLYNGNSTFTNCTFTGTRGMKICDEYAGEVGSVGVDGCTFDNISEKPGIAIDDEDTQDMKITIKNSTFINCKAGDQKLYIYETDNTVPTLENNTVENGYDAATMGGLYEFLPTLTKGSVLVLPAGTYNTSGTLTIPDGVTIKGAEGAEVIFHQSSAAQDNIFNCEGDAVIENITFESNRKGYAVNGAAKNHDTDGDITIINCKFKGIATEKNWGVYKNLYGDLILQNCTFDNYNNAICGVSNGGDSTTVITGCTFTNINGEAIGYVISSVPADFETKAIENNTGLTADNVIGY